MTRPPIAQSTRRDRSALQTTEPFSPSLKKDIPQFQEHDWFAFAYPKSQSGRLFLHVLPTRRFDRASAPPQPTAIIALQCPKAWKIRQLTAWLYEVVNHNQARDAHTRVIGAN